MSVHLNVSSLENHKVINSFARLTAYLVLLVGGAAVQLAGGVVVAGPGAALHRRLHIAPAAVFAQLQIKMSRL